MQDVGTHANDHSKLDCKFITDRAGSLDDVEESGRRRELAGELHIDRHWRFERMMSIDQPLLQSWIGKSCCCRRYSILKHDLIVQAYIHNLPRNQLANLRQTIF